MTEDATIDEAQDRRHPAPGDAYARESVVYMAHIGDIDATVSVYTWVHGDGTAGCSAVLMRAGHATLAEGHPDEPINDAADFDNWRLGPLHLMHKDPGRTARVEWKGQKFAFAIDFTAMHPPYAYGQGPRGCPTYVAQDRVEQAGHIELTLTHDGVTNTYSCTGHRDHSWGIRDWGMMQQDKWIEAQTTDCGVHVFEINAKGNRTVYGYVYRDGHMSSIDTAQFDVRFDSDVFATEVVVDIVDLDGRRTSLRTQEQARTEIHVSPAATLVDVSAAVTIDGVAGGGWVDFSWPPDYLAHMRKRANEL